VNVGKSAKARLLLPNQKPKIRVALSLLIQYNHKPYTQQRHQFCAAVVGVCPYKISWKKGAAG
jgi:hypothetical protein